MIQELFRIPVLDLPVSPFGVLLVAAFFSGFWQLRRNMDRFGIGDDDDASAILFAALVGGILGGKLYFVALYADWRLFFDRSGFVWYGGFILGTAAVLWTLRRRRLPFATTVDAAAPALALGYGVGRIGCFLVGDDYGVPTDLPWGIEFRQGTPPTTAANLRELFGVEPPPGVSPDDFVAVHPTQLYETAIALVIWGVGMWLLRRRPRPGLVSLVVLGMMAVERFGIEILRAKDDRFFGPFTVAQVISLVILVVVTLLFLRLRGAPARRREPGARSA